MTGELEPEKLRISDSDRHRLAEFLRDAAGDGRIDLEELDERIEATYSAKTYADLVPIVVDLPGNSSVLGLNLPSSPRADGYEVYTPATRPSPEPPATGRPEHSVPTTRRAAGVPTAEHRSSVAMMSGCVRRGVWEISEAHTAFAIMGGVELDLREAVFPASEVVIHANAIMGGIDITVNAHTRVVIDGIGIMGGFEESKPKVAAAYDADSPVLRVKGVALMGGVTVTRKQMPGEPGPKRFGSFRH